MSLLGAIRNLTSFEVKDFLQGNDPVILANIQARNGFFQLRRTPVMDFIQNAPATEEFGPEIQKGMHLRVPKIPFDIFNYIFAFTREVYKRDRTESTVMVFFNKGENKYYAWAPKQKNGDSSSEYIRNGDPDYTERCKNMTLVMIAHSHPWGGTAESKPIGAPHPSPTDDGDERDGILYMILSSVECKYPSYFLSTCPSAIRHPLQIEKVFDLSIPTTIPEPLRGNLDKMMNPENRVALLANPDISVIPESWFAQCIKEKDIPTSITGFSKKKTIYPADEYGDDWYDGRKSVNTVKKISVNALDTLSVYEEMALVIAERMIELAPELKDGRVDVFEFCLDLTYNEMKKFLVELEVDGRTAVARFQNELFIAVSAHRKLYKAPEAAQKSLPESDAVSGKTIGKTTRKEFGKKIAYFAKNSIKNQEIRQKVVPKEGGQKDSSEKERKFPSLIQLTKKKGERMYVH